jgi:branched-chain amino acid transport system permease protein
MDYILHLLIFVLLYGMVVLGLNVSSGFTQLISLCHASFFGLGAYTSAILATRADTPVWLNLVIGMVLAGVIAVPVGLLARRVSDDKFIICTLGAGLIIWSVQNNAVEITRGPLGIPAIPSATFFGHTILQKWEWLILVGTLYALEFYVARNLKKSALGRVLVSISQDEVFCQSLGKNVNLAKLQSFVLGAMLAAVPGVLYAHYVSFIDPTTFSIDESVFLLTVVLVGGLGNLRGSLFATTFMILGPEFLRFIGLPKEVAAPARQVIYGVMLILVVLRPQRTDLSLVMER